MLIDGRAEEKRTSTLARKRGRQTWMVCFCLVRSTAIKKNFFFHSIQPPLRSALLVTSMWFIETEAFETWSMVVQICRVRFRLASLFHLFDHVDDPFTDKRMSANMNHLNLRTLNRTPQPPANPPSMSESGGSVIDTIRKRMQQIKDELARSQDELQSYQIEREREKHLREQVWSLKKWTRSIWTLILFLGWSWSWWSSTSFTISWRRSWTYWRTFDTSNTKTRRSFTCCWWKRTVNSINSST